MAHGLLAAIKADTGWLDGLECGLDRATMQKLDSFLKEARAGGAPVYPLKNDVFKALNTTRLSDVRVVILGQDPYHGPGQAHGLCFSVPVGVTLPPSLKNIYKEIEAEYGRPMPRNGDLTGWARQGVLLLNAVMTVEDGRAGSHRGKGWEDFTDAVVRTVNERCDHVVFMLWGAYALKKGCFIQQDRHLVLQSVHPSPLSAHRGFLGNGHFMAANRYLTGHGHAAIDWYAL
jgi:uracil-DNA glycosylase